MIDSKSCTDIINIVHVINHSVTLYLLYVMIGVSLVLLPAAIW